MSEGFLRAQSYKFPLVALLMILLHCLALFAFSKSEENLGLRRRRGYFRSIYPSESNQLRIGGIDVDYFGKSEDISLESTEGAGKPLSTSQYESKLSNQRFRSPELHQIPQVTYVTSNDIDRPVQEPQDLVPPLPTGTVIIPRLPPPATPVNAAAFNIPSNGGAVFLGSGSLGVIDLGGGAYALGSGALGYSERRSNPRSSFRAPLLPPVQAAPNLIPAAVNTPLPSQQTPIVEFQFPVTGQLPTDQNGYEYLPPNRVGFGDPLPPRPLKTRNAFATPTALQLPPPVYPPLDQSHSVQLPQSDLPPQLFQMPQLLQTTQPVTPRDVDYAQIYGQVVTDTISSSYKK